jgi:hypothetical protein
MSVPQGNSIRAQKQSAPAKASGTMDCFRLRSLSFGGRVAEPVIGRATRWLAMTNYRFRTRPIDPTGKSPKTCPALRAKIFRLTRRANQRYGSARLTRREGRCARHEMRGGMRWTRKLRETNAAERGRRSRVVLTPRRWRQVREKQVLTDDGDNKARSPGRSRRKPLKPSRREGRVSR